ncbi:MAG TPA: helical backbone metal receptor [Myxococcota bacterium]|nr:helical backbone metal receptor [Myxococcota bacterium]
MPTFVPRVAALAVLLVAVALRGVAAAPDAGPKRIVSLNPSLTAILVTVGARERLAGVDDFSARSQPEVAGLPTVGGFFNPSLEAVVAVRPDLVVLVPSAEQRSFVRQLEELGIAVESYDPVSFEDVLATIEKLGARVGHGDAARARVVAIRDAKKSVEEAAAARPRRRTVLVLQRDPLFVVGRGTFVAEMMAAAGADNVGNEFTEPWPRVTQEWLLAAKPDVILDASEGAAKDADRYWRRWPSLPAVKQGRVVPVPEGVVTLPGPWLDHALFTLDAALARKPKKKPAPGPLMHRPPPQLRHPPSPKP